MSVYLYTFFSMKHVHVNAYFYDFYWSQCVKTVFFVYFFFIFVFIFRKKKSFDKKILSCWNRRRKGIRSETIWWVWGVFELWMIHTNIPRIQLRTSSTLSHISWKLGHLELVKEIWSKSILKSFNESICHLLQSCEKCNKTVN